MSDDRAFLVHNPEQRSRIAHAQKLLHSAVAALDVVRIRAGGRHEERDLEKAYALCADAEGIVGDLVMADAVPCWTCGHELVEHDGGTDGFGDDACREPCRHADCACLDFSEEIERG